MRLLASSIIALLCAGGVAFVWLADSYGSPGDPAVSLPTALIEPDSSKEPVRPLPSSVTLDPRKVTLGRKLFHDGRLSRDGTVSCASCHQGVNIGGNMYQQFGVMLARDGDNPAVDRLDLGRFNVTGREEDKFVFKVPSLRNVALTAPYFHDGSAPDLATAVSVMAEAQLGRQLADEQVECLVAFLESLTGELPMTAVQ